jgi:hypothetical protein
MPVLICAIRVVISCPSFVVRSGLAAMRDGVDRSLSFSGQIDAGCPDTFPSGVRGPTAELPVR